MCTIISRAICILFVCCCIFFASFAHFAQYHFIILLYWIQINRSTKITGSVTSNSEYMGGKGEFALLNSKT